MKRGDMKVRTLTHGSNSKIKRYTQLILGSESVLALLRYELIVTFCSALPGALGLFLRSKLYPLIIGSVGRNVIFGTNVTLRHPHKIRIGDDVIIDDNVMIDAKGITNLGIEIGDGVFIGRNTILSCKDGDIVLGSGVNVGFNCEIFSSSRVVLGDNVLVAAYTYIVGGGGYDLNDIERAFVEQQALNSRGIEVHEGAWLAARTTVLDGATIGAGAAIGAGAIVRESVPSMAIAVGVPARVLRYRDGRAAGKDDARKDDAHNVAH